MSRFVLTAQLQLQAPTNTAQVVRQIQNQLNNVQVNLQVQGTAQATRQVNQVAQSINAANTAASNLGRTFAISVRRFTALAVATRAVSLFTNTLAKATEEAINFERELIRISQVTGKSIKNLRDLTKTINNLSTSLGVSSSSLISVSRILSQAGLNAKETEVALSTLAKTELAPTFDNITETAEGAVAIFNQFRLGAEALEEQLGSINAVAGRFAVEAGDLIGAVRRVGGVFKASGGDLNELIALFTSVRATTRESAESIATGLRTIFTRIQRPKTIEFLKRFGIELVDLEGKFVGPFEATRRLSEALSGLEQGDITFIKIAEELGGFRQIGKVIPLLQQFQVAQEALNVAQKGSSSLSKDAASAQEALAVRITKVKEEFLALVRSITETSSFQLFANTALNLASSLIKLADALKPIIPLLTAVAGIRLAQGLGGFLAGFRGGIGSGRTFNQGGKVLQFAKGGIVPGSGSRDSVRAMVQPGEFVMRKRAVDTIGADTLATMNKGGKIQIKRGAIGGFFLQPEKGEDRDIPIDFVGTIKNSKVLSLLGSSSFNDPKFRQEAFLSADSETQKQILYGKKGAKDPENKSLGKIKDTYNGKNVLTSKGEFASGTGLRANAASNARLTQFLKSGKLQVDEKSKLAKNIPISGTIKSYFPGGTDTQNNSLVSNIVAETTKRSLRDAILSARKPIAKIFAGASAIKANEASFSNAGNRIANDPNAKRTTEGFIFEGIIQAVTGAQLSGSQSNFDFPFSSIFRSRAALKAMFADNSGEGIDYLIKADAKRSNTPDAKKSIQRKILNDINRNVLGGLDIQKFAKGGEAIPQKGIQSAGVGIFDSDMIAGGTNVKNAILQALIGSRKPYSVISGPAGSGKTTFATSRFGRNFVLSPQDLEKYARFVVLSGAGVTKTGDFSPETDKLFRGAKDITALSPDEKRLMQQRQGRLDTAISGGSPDQRSIGALKGTLKAPTSSNLGLLSRYPNVRILQKYATGGLVPGSGNRDTVPAVLQKGDFVIRKSSVKKLGVENLASMAKYAAGGNVNNSVSALVTPGEFVVDSEAAQKIGYGTLNRMNKVGKYANGGAVGVFSAKKFASGGRASGGGNMLENNMGLGITLVSSALQSMIPPIEENSSTLQKLSSGFLSLVTQIGGVIFALQAFGVTITKDIIGKGLKSLTTRGKGGLGDIIGGFQKSTGVGGKITTVRRTGESFGEGFNAPRNNQLIQKQITDLRSKAPSPLGLQSAQQRQGIANQIKSLRSQRIFPTSLTGRLGSFLGQQAAGGGFMGRAAGLAARGVSSIGGLGSIGGGAVGSALGGVAAAAGPALAVTAAVAAINSLVGSFRDLDGKLKEAIKAEDIAKAQSLAVSQSNAASLPIIGNLVGGFADLIGAGDSLANFFNFFGGQSASQIKANIATQIQASKAQKALAKASENSAKALQEFQNGTISAIEVLRSTSEATKEASELRRRTEEQISANEETGKSTGFDAFRRNLGAYFGGGLFGMETADTRNKRIDKENKELRQQGNKAEEEAIKAATPGLQVLQKQVAATGGSFNDFLNILQKEDVELYNMVLRQGSKDLTASFTNIAKEAERTRKAFNAMNLGFQKVQAVSGALSVGLENYLASQEMGFIPLENSIRTLEASVTSAAQGISDADFKSALSDARDGLRDLGASEDQITKFEENIGAINTAQKFYAKATQEVQNQLVERFKAGRGTDLSPEGQKASFAKALVGQLDGVDEATKQRISDAIAGADISPDDLAAIADGNMAVLDKVLKDLGDTTLNQVIGPFKDLAKYDKILVDLTKKKIDLENSAIAAQRGVLQAQLEAQEIIAQYGGPALTPQIRAANAIQQANLQTQGTGVSALRTGSAAELQRRSQETRNRLAEIGEIRQDAAIRGGNRETSGVAGAELQAEEQRLQELAKSDYEITKLLIKTKEDELKLIREKNKLEQDSINALISGDFDKFFEQQAAVGAQAAIALGSDRLQGAFGASALGVAAQDIKRQQEAGVQELYGRKLSGPGGLTEAAYGAAVGARGITDPRLARVAAGTTAAEQSIEQEIRDLATTLPNYAETQLEVTQQALMAADIQIEAAQKQLEAARMTADARAGGVPVARKAKGGLIYANRGIFVPRGTDTVPAMLTPGEFVVRREAVQRGNNLQILKTMNRGMGTAQAPINGAVGLARGGMVRYLSGGGESGDGSIGFNTEIINSLIRSLDSFNKDLTSNITKLQNTTLSIKLDTTNVNVNLTGGSFLAAMTEQVQGDILKKIIAKLENNFKVESGGRIKYDPSVTSNK